MIDVIVRGAYDDLNGYEVSCCIHHQPAVFETRFVMDLNGQAFDFIMVIGRVEAHLGVSMVQQLAKRYKRLGGLDEGIEEGKSWRRNEDK